MRGPDLLSEVAAVLASGGWSVAVEETREGLQLDIVARPPQGSEVLVECKAYSRLVGLKTVREFAGIVEHLRERTPDLEAWLVTTRGFTRNAQRALARHRTSGHTLDELKVRFGLVQSHLGQEIAKWRAKAVESRERKPRIFVIMPFSDAMLDVFIFGIGWAANQLDAVAERADDLEHGGEIIAEIRRAIESYDAVVADTTGANPNVCYEVGYAHALKRPTVLICRRGENLPFDLRGTNHLMYGNINGLREPLKSKLETVLRKPR